MKKRGFTEKTEKIFYIAASILICLMTIWLFFDFEAWAFLLLLLSPLMVKNMLKKAERKRKWALNVAFLDSLQFMKNGLNAGYSPEGCVREARKGLEKLYGDDARITKEFTTMEAQISMGITMEEALMGFAKRCQVEDVSTFAELFSILKRTGGDLDKVIQQTTSNLRDRLELARELNIVVAEKLGEFRLMCAIPYGILLYLRLCAPSMCEPLYHNLPGCVFMCGMLLLYIACIVAGEWIMNNRMRE